MKHLKPVMLLTFVLISIALHGQRLQENFRKSIYTVIYKLDSTSASEIYAAGFLRDSTKYFVNPVDSFRYDKAFDYNSLKTGIYLFLSGEENNVRYWLWEQPVFRLRSLGVNGQIHVFAYDLKGMVIKDARLKLISNGNTIYYKDDCGCYPIPVTDKKMRYRSVQFLLFRGEDFTFGSLNLNYDELFPKKVKRQRHQRNDNFYQPMLLPGYLVLNQPKFKQLDTLKWKAFLTKPNGKPYKKEILVRTMNDHTGVMLKQQGLKPTTKGAYSGELFIADTLTLDQQYSLQLLNRKGRLLKSETFRVENYDLKKAFFNATVNKPYAYAGEDIRFTVSAFDANNLPLPDARISVLVTLSQITDVFNDSMFIPFSWNQKYWEYNTLSDPGGITVIPFPDTLKLNALMMMNARITITLPEGESKQYDLTLQYNPEKIRYLLTQDNDSIRAVYLYNSQIQPKPAIIKAFNGNPLYEKEVMLPYTFAVEDYPLQYQLIADSTVRASLDSPDYPAVHPSFEGIRTYDSIHFTLMNPLKINVNYKIFHGSEVVDGGSGKLLDYRKKYPSDESFHVIYSYRLRGTEYVKEQIFQSREKGLTVKIDQPEVIYPGQKIAVNVHVTDYKNRDVRNANLAAYAVNTQIGDIKEPLMPYFGTTKGGLLRTFQTWSARPEINNTKPVTRFYAQMPFLAESPYYKLVYNLTGLGKVYEPIEEDKTEFCPYVLKGPENQAIYSIYVDKKPVYYAQTNLKNPLSFEVAPGKHDIQVRTRTKMLTVKNVEFIQGQKLFLCLSDDSLRKHPDVSYVNLPQPYLDEEKEGISKHLLYYYPAFGKKANKYYFIQGKRVFWVMNWNHYNANNLAGNYFVAGPFERGLITVACPGEDSLEFYFEPGSGYTLYDDSAVVKPHEQLNLNVPSMLTQMVYNAPMVLSERAFRWPLLPVKREIPAPPPVVKQVRTHPALHDYGTPYSEKGYSHFSLKNKTSKNIKRIWFFNKDNEKDSRICFSPCYWMQYIKPGLYDILIISQNDSVCLFPDYRVNPDGTHYKFIRMADFKPYDSLLISNFEDRIVKLNRPVPRIFNNPPVAVTDVSKVLKGETKENKLSGYVLDQNGNPIDMVTVFLENAGVFTAGAITNQIGYFELNAGKLNSGQLKLFLNGKFYTFSPLFMASGKNTELQIRLPNAQGQSYNWDLNPVNISATYSNGSSPAYTSYDQNINLASVESVEISSLAGKVYGMNITKGFKEIRLPDLSSGREPVSSINPDGQAPKNKFSEFLDKIKSDTNAGRIRSKFRDYAYFIPNLFTDKNGEAHFTVIFPDNQTLWKTMVPAMDYHKRSGLGVSEVKAFKPLNATLALPKFCIEGDSVKIIGKIYNYTEKELSLTSSFKFHKTENPKKEQKIKSFLTETCYLHFDSTGTYPVEYSFETPDTYFDGERRDLPVLVNGIETASSRNFIAENDTSFTITSIEGSSRTTLTITNNKLDLISKLAEQLLNYNYGCNEQTASKLIAVLTQKSLLPALGKEFKDDKLIVSLIRRLEKNQQKNGSWGWWTLSEKTEDWMTIYIVRALDMATKAGFYTRAHVKGAEYLRTNLDRLSMSDRIFAIQVLADFYPKEAYKKHVESFDIRLLSLQDQFRLMRLKQILGMPVSLDTVLTTMVKGKDGCYWGEEVLDFKTNIIPVSALAYEVLKNDTIDHKPVLKQVRKYFLTHTAKARNTIEQAVMLQTIVGDILAENQLKQEINPELLVDGQPYALVKSPQTLNIADNSKVSIAKKGAPLYFSLFQYYLDRDPKPSDSLYSIKTRMEQKGKEIRIFEKSVPVSYQIEITAARATEYVMIEIPIPSTCFYAEKNAGKMPYEVHREYFNDKVVVFCRNLPKGKHSLMVSLQPMFEGRSTLLPVKASLMYYPDHYGTNTKSEVRVRE